MSLRVSFVIGLLDGLGGGTEQHLLHLCQGLPARGFEPEVVCVFDHAFLKSRPLPCPVTALGPRVPLAWRPLAVERLRRHWAAGRPRAALAFFDDAQYVAAEAAGRLGLRAVLSARRNMGHERGRWSGWEVRASNPGVRRFLCNSEAVRERAVGFEGIPRERTTVVYNGIDLDFPPAEDWRPAFGVPPGAPVVVCVSGMRPVKGVDIFLTAFSRVVRQVPAAHALLIGDGSERPRLESRVRDLGLAGRAHFAGWRDDARPLLRGCSAAALTSHSEGFSNAVLEYMAAGLPTVATRVGGNPEAIRDGRDGLLVPPGDVTAIAAALCRLLEDASLAGSMGREAALRAHACFGREVMLDQVAQALKREIEA